MLLAAVAWILFGDPAVFRGPMVGILMGVASGATMLPTSIIKEANPPQLAGSATGVLNVINFSLSTLLGPAFGARLARSPGDTEVVGLAHHQAGFIPLLYGILLALILTFFLRETGPATKVLDKG